jgi:hypothetical protein
MASGKFTIKFPSTLKDGKKKDIKLLAIAGALLLVFLGLMFWLFSEPAQDPDAGHIVPAAIDSAAEQNAAPTTPAPPILDEKAIQQALGEENTQLNQPQQSVNTGGNVSIIAPQPNFDEAINQFVSGSNFSTEAAAVANTTSGTDLQSVNIINQPKMNLQEMKEYLNIIKKDILIKNGAFYYNEKAYKVGDSLNSLSIINIEKYTIRFASNDVEYSLRFTGGSK